MNESPDKVFHRLPGEALGDWQQRISAMQEHVLSCHLRQRKKVWLDLIRDSIRKQPAPPREAR